MKPLHAEWTIISFRETGCDTVEILRGWAKAGISAILEGLSSPTTNGTLLVRNGTLKTNVYLLLFSLVFCTVCIINIVAKFM